MMRRIKQYLEYRRLKKQLREWYEQPYYKLDNFLDLLNRLDCLGKRNVRIHVLGLYRYKMYDKVKLKYEP
jgi:hypothetical protein